MKVKWNCAHSGERVGRRDSPKPRFFFTSLYLTCAEYAFCCSECLLWCERDVSNYLPFCQYNTAYTSLNLGVMAVGNKEPVEYFKQRE